MSEKLSPLYYHNGHMARLFSDGWHCTCFSGPDCEHIKEAKKQHEAATKQGEPAKEKKA